MEFLMASMMVAPPLYYTSENFNNQFDKINKIQNFTCMPGAVSN